MEETTVRFRVAAGPVSGSGYLASAEGGAGLGVVVLSDEGILTPHVRGVCGRLVEEGFTALAPDLPGLPDAGVAHAAADVASAIDLLVGHGAVRGDGVAVVGFGHGARLALWVASLRPEHTRAVIPFYALPPADAEPDWARVEASVEGHFAEDDEALRAGTVEALEGRLTDLGKDVRMFTYPGVSSGFFDETRTDRYDADAARQAWVRTLEFLRAKLG